MIIAFGGMNLLCIFSCVSRVCIIAGLHRKHARMSLGKNEEMPFSYVHLTWKANVGKTSGERGVGVIY